MFTLPTLPMDNLYKFSFVGGIILIIFSLYLLDQANQAKIKTKATFARAKVELKIDSLLTVREAIQDSIDGVKPYRGKEYTHKSLQGYELTPLNRAKMDSLLQTGDKMSDGLTNFDIATNHEFFGYLGLLIGCILLFYGSNNWQKHMQEPQDRLLAIQVKMAEIDLLTSQLKLDQMKKEINPPSSSPSDQKAE